MSFAQYCGSIRFGNKPGVCPFSSVFKTVLHRYCYRFRVQSSTVKVVKVFDFESNAEFIRALKLTEWAFTENELP